MKKLSLIDLAFQSLIAAFLWTILCFRLKLSLYRAGSASAFLQLAFSRLTLPYIGHRAFLEEPFSYYC